MTGVRDRWAVVIDVEDSISVIIFVTAISAPILIDVELPGVCDKGAVICAVPNAVIAVGPDSEAVALRLKSARGAAD